MAAIAVIVIAITIAVAIAITVTVAIVVAFKKNFFNLTEVFVELVAIVEECINVFRNNVYLVGHIRKNVNYKGNKLSFVCGCIIIHAFHHTLEMCYLFADCHNLPSLGN